MALFELSLFLKVGAVAAKTSPAQDSASLVAPAESSARLPRALECPEELQVTFRAQQANDSISLPAGGEGRLCFLFLQAHTDLAVSWGLPDFVVYIHRFSEGSLCFASRAKRILD